MNYLKSIIILLNFFLIKSETFYSPWTPIGTGVFYRSNINNIVDEKNILITYSGWKVNEIQSKTWFERLFSKSMLNNDFYKINNHYCVIGPKDTQYTSLEIQNSKLISNLYELYSNPNTKLKLIVIVAHSSGSFVADEFFQQLYNKIYQAINSGNTQIAEIGLKLSTKIVYYNLDGAITPTNKNNFYLSTLFSKIYFVWASKRFDTLILRSMNANSMISASSYFPNTLSNGIEVTTNKATCINSSCMHDVLITEIPYDISSFNTDKDYTSFNENNEVQFDYLSQTVSTLRDMINKL